MASQDWFEKDFYKILGVTKDTSDADLKKVYRKLAREFHPDSNPGDAKAEARFKEISEAYSVLSDPAQRKEYDAVRAMGGGARFTGGAGGQGFPGGFSGGSAGGFEDVFANLFGQGGSSGRGGNPFGGFGGFGPQRGSDLTMSTNLNFIDGVQGTSIKVKLNGKEVSVNIPAGVNDGQKIKLRGKGQPSPNGGEAGDLIITCNIKPHPIFTRDGNNIRVTVPVTFAEAVLGATILVPTLGGEPVKLKVAPGTPNGRVLRVKGRGVVTAKHSGDLLATVDIAVPREVNDKAREALEAFEAQLPEADPRADLLLKAGLL